MDLFEEINENENSKKKTNGNVTKVLVIVGIIVTLVVIIGIIIAMMYLKSSKMKFYVDGQQIEIQESYFQITEDGKIYASIEDMANILGVEYYKGEYGRNSEDTSKGYIINKENETTIFEANTNKIYKLNTNTNEGEYSYFYIDENIKYENNKLYTTADGINKIFDAILEYNQNINIRTLEKLVDMYTSKIENYGYKSVSENFINKKALKNGIIIAQKENGKYGILSYNGNEIVGAKYNEIQYMETTGEFLVKSGSKYGIINSQGKSKIDLDYDEIKILDEDLQLYIVKNNNKYGVLNQSGNIVIYPEYDEIGIDSSMYKEPSLKNKYLLFENCIPVKKEDKWGIFNKGGKIILPIEYDTIGCQNGTSSSRTAGNVVIIPDYEAIVVGKGDYFAVINSTGKELIACALSTVYTITSEGKTTYRIEGVQNGTPYSYDIDKYFDAVGIKKVTRGSEEKSYNETELDSNNTNITKSSSEDNDDDENDEEEEEEEEEEKEEESDED